MITIIPPTVPMTKYILADVDVDVVVVTVKVEIINYIKMIKLTLVKL